MSVSPSWPWPPAGQTLIPIVADETAVPKPDEGVSVFYSIAAAALQAKKQDGTVVTIGPSGGGSGLGIAARCTLTGGASPTIAYEEHAVGITLAVSHIATGLYRLRITGLTTAGTDIDKVISAVNVGSNGEALGLNATFFNANVSAGTFDVRIQIWNAGVESNAADKIDVLITAPAS